MNERLISYIKKSMDGGYNVNYIKKVLLDAGHNLMAVEEHIRHVMKSKQNEKLKEFIIRHAEKGSDMGKIKESLMRAGHDIKIIEEYIDQAIENQINKKQKIRKYVTIGIIGLATIIILIIAFYFFTNYKNTDLLANETQLAEAEHQKNLDIFNKALISNDADACSQIENNKLKEECKSKFAYNYNMSNGTIDETFESKGLLNKALINQNISICAEIKDDVIKKQCGQILKR